MSINEWNKMNKFARRTIELCRLGDETTEETIERLLTMLLPVASDIEALFGPQTPYKRPKTQDEYKAMADKFFPAKL